MNITRAAFVGGKSPYSYATAFGAHLFLSLNPEDVKQALAAGCAAAMLWHGKGTKHLENELRIAFDGDAVLFSDEAERVFQNQGLQEFNQSEHLAAAKPLSPGPFKGFLSALHLLQKQELPLQIRTALVTARCAPAHERVINTLREWNIRIDEALFLGGLKKVEFLKAFGADIFFDDQEFHCSSVANDVTAAHVPYGVMNIPG